MKTCKKCGEKARKGETVHSEFWCSGCVQEHLLTEEQVHEGFLQLYVEKDPPDSCEKGMVFVNYIDGLSRDKQISDDLVNSITLKEEVENG
jgi:hypothetical protein